MPEVGPLDFAYLEMINHETDLKARCHVWILDDLASPPEKQVKQKPCEARADFGSCEQEWGERRAAQVRAAAEAPAHAGHAQADRGRGPRHTKSSHGNRGHAGTKIAKNTGVQALRSRKIQVCRH